MVALLLAEGLLRLAPGLLPPEAQARLHWQVLRGQDSVAPVAEPYLGSLPAPRQHTVLHRADFRFAYTTDGLGFRNAEPWPDTAEIVAVGDSWVFGYGVDVEQSWLRLVADSVGKNRVVNLGVTGASPQQYVRAYERYGAPLHPRLLILGLFPGNDLEDAKVFEQWLEAGSPKNYDLWRLFQGDRTGGGITDRSYLLLTIRALRRNWQSPFSGATVTMADGGRLRLAPGFFQSLPNRARPGHPDFERVMASVERADSMSRSLGTLLLVLLFPTKEAVYLPVIGKPAPVAVEAFPPELEARGIDYIDLLPVFRARARAGETVFWEVDGHPNVRGNQLIAEAVLERLRREGGAYGLEVGAPARAVAGP